MRFSSQPSKRSNVAARLSILLVLLLSISASAMAQIPYRVIDLDPGVTGEESSNPRHLVLVGERVVFIADTPGTGEEVWASDGTTAGTFLLSDIRPGSADSGPRILGRLGDVVFFTGLSTGERELWRSDGTRAGTFRLRQYDRTLIQETWVFADDYLILAEDDGDETRLFRTDGTPAGTFDVVTLPQGQPHLASRGTDIGILDRQGGFWLSDGTPGGTTQLDDLTPDLGTLRPLVATAERYFLLASDNGAPAQLWTTAGGAPLPLSNFGAAVSIESLVAGAGHAYLTINTGSGLVVWRSDGTIPGTRQMTPATVRATGFSTGQFVELGTRILFSGTEVGSSNRRVFASDGTPAGTELLSDTLIVGIEPWVGLGDRVVIEGVHPNDGFQLWTSDGSPAGTRLLVDQCAAGESCLGQNHALSPGLDGVVFASDTAAEGFELWTSDGTTPGTRRVTDFAEPEPLPPHFDPEPWLAADDDTLVFAANAAGLGEELWRTTGDPASTTLLADVAPADAASSVRELGRLGGRLLFTACDGNRLGLWSTGGSEADTELLQLFDAAAGCQPTAGNLVNAADSLLFLTFADRELWVSDGTAAGTRRVLGPLAPAQSLRRPMVAVGDRLLFVVGSPVTGSFWLSDGTVAGTAPFAPLAGLDFQTGADAVSIGDLVFVRAGGIEGDGDLVVTDGTAAGTELLHHFNDFFPAQALEAVELGGLVYLSFGTGPNGIWRSDGTAAGTFEVLPIGSGGIVGRPRDLTVFGDRLIFASPFSADDDGLWSSDGGTAPPTLLTDFPRVSQSGAAEPSSLEPTAVGSRLFFVIDDGLRGRELWSSDGTPGGTALWADIVPGAPASDPRHLTVLGDQLYFTASNTFGEELWTLAGTTTGVARVGDIAPGAASSSPEQLTPVGGRLYFTADDLVSGRELWAVGATGGPVDDCDAGTTTLCLGGGRFRLTADWETFGGERGSGTAIPVTDDTGGFWFFGPANLELMVKVIDGRDFNGNFWVFYGALSNVAFELTVEDTVTGASKTYTNPLGTFASRGDVEALPGD